MPKRKTSRGRENKKEETSQGFSVGDGGLVDKLQDDLQKNQSFLNLVLGALIVIVLGIILYNYFNKEDNSTTLEQSTQDLTEDVTKDDLPGKYTVKEGDTLFSIAQKYYDDGNKYTEIVKENKLDNENQISAGQSITLPKLPYSGTSSADVSATQEPSPSASPSSIPTVQATSQPATELKGAEFSGQNPWGPKISGESYTVQAGDWLSTIAGRAYGDIMSFDRIAKANNLKDPNLIEIGQNLKIPR